MVKQYRTKEEIINKILSSIKEDKIPKTKLMYEAYLSHKQLKAYLQILFEGDLIKVDEKTKKCSLTSKGHKYLELSNEIIKLEKS